MTFSADMVLISLAQALAALFATALAGLVALVRGNLGALRQHTWFRRWCTWTVIATVVLGAFWLGGAAVVALGAGVAWQAAREAAALLDLRRAYRRALILGAPTTILAVVAWPAALAWLPGVFMLGLLAVALADSGVEKGGGRGQISAEASDQMARALLGYVWAPWLLGHVTRLGMHVDGTMWLLTLGLAVALADVGACVVGSFAGGPKLAPRISPGKTWSGVLGAVGAAYIAFAITAPIRPVTSGWVTAILPLVIVVAGVVGDLFESWLKRAAGVKDAGDWLPGFGGLLDRIDSLLLAAPAAWWVLSLAAALGSGS